MSNLEDANLMFANLTHANLRGANLHHTDLRFATCEGADLTDAPVSTARLNGVADQLGLGVLPRELHYVLRLPDGSTPYSSYPAESDTQFAASSPYRKPTSHKPGLREDE